MTSPNQKPCADIDESVEFLKLAIPGGPWTLSVRYPEKDSPLTTRTFSASEEAQLRHFLYEQDGVRNVYWLANEPVGTPVKKPQKADMKAARFLYVDVDAKNGNDVDSIVERCESLVKSGKLPTPTFQVFSGGGCQFLWRLAEPAPLGSEPERAEYEKYNQALEDLFGGKAGGADACHNCDRILRLPGSVNRPDEKKRAAGRVDTLARLLSDNNGSYSLEQFRQRQPKPPKQVSAPTTPVADDGHIDGDPASDAALTFIPDDRLRWIIRFGGIGFHPKTGRPFAHGVPDEHTGEFAQDCLNAAQVAELGLEMFPHEEHEKKDLSASGWEYRAARRARHIGLKLSLIAALWADPSNGVAAQYAKENPSEQRQQRRMEKLAEVAVDTDVDLAPDEEFEYDKEGKTLVKSEHNLLVAMKKMGVRVSYNELTDRQLIEGMPGWGPQMRDRDLNHLRLEIGRRFYLRFNKEMFNELIEDISYSNTFHPIHDYFASLPAWDGTPRLDRWLVDYAGAEDTPLNRAFGRLMLLAAVRRVRQPGVKFDFMLVLVGQQGLGKSSLIASLVPDRSWFQDDVSLQLTGKQAIEQLQGKWILEFGEMRGLSASDQNTLKAFITRQVDSGRLSYERKVCDVPRSCVFFATTNEEKFLQDQTGNRRFWPVRCTKVDPSGLASIREQLWAEACLREAQGETIALDSSLYEAATDVQEAHREDDPYFDILEPELGDREGWILLRDVYTLLKLDVGEKRVNIARRIAFVMQQLGWKKQRTRLFSKGDRNCFPCYWRRGTSDCLLSVRIDAAGRRSVCVDVPNDYEEFVN